MSKPFIEIYSTLVGKSLDSSYLSEAEEQVANQRRQSEEYRFIRNWMRICLGQSLGLNPAKLEFATKNFGKPHLKGIPLWFNLSHSRDQAYLAVTSFAEVGLDIEIQHSRPKYLELAMRFFHKNEIRALEEMDVKNGQLLFLKLWTIKEALVKESGEGLTNKLASIDALDFLKNPSSWMFEKQQFQLYHREKNNIVMSLVWRGLEEMEIVCVTD